MKKMEALKQITEQIIKDYGGVIRTSDLNTGMRGEIYQMRLTAEGAAELANMTRRPANQGNMIFSYTEYGGFSANSYSPVPLILAQFHLYRRGFQFTADIPNQVT